MAKPASRRRWLVIVSLAAHAGVIAVYVVVGMWRIERVSLERSPVQFASGRISLPDQGDGLPPGERPEDPKPDKPTVVVEGPRQPRVIPDPPEIKSTGGDGTAVAAATGGGGPGGETASTGEVCLGPDCKTTPTETTTEKLCPGDPGCPEPPFRSPIEVGKARLTGETQIVPADVTKTAMARDGKPRVLGIVRFCLDLDGRVTSAAIQRPTGYADYDARLVDGVRRWTYRPQTIGGTPIPVCSTVSFAFSMR